MKALFMVILISISSTFALGAGDVCKSQSSYKGRVDLANGDIRFEGPRQDVGHLYYVSFEGTDFDSVCKSLFSMRKHIQAAKKNVDFSGRILVATNGDIIFRDHNTYNYLTDPVIDWIVCSNRE